MEMRLECKKQTTAGHDQDGRAVEGEEEDEEEDEEDDDIESHARRLDKKIGQLMNESSLLETDRDRLELDKVLINMINV